MPTINNTRILPLGDSLTRGWAVAGDIPGGYRSRLERQLITRAAVRTRPWLYVGNQRTNIGDNLIMLDHAGINGERIDQMQTRIGTALSTYNPHVVLIHAGTNDANQAFLISTAGARIATLVQTCLDHPSVLKVYVAQIVGCNPATLSTDGVNTIQTHINSINSQIPIDLTTQVATGKCHIVNMSALLTWSSDYSTGSGDNLHPNATGHGKIAGAWADAIEANPPSQP